MDSSSFSSTIIYIISNVCFSFALYLSTYIVLCTCKSGNKCYFGIVLLLMVAFVVIILCAGIYCGKTNEAQTINTRENWHTKAFPKQSHSIQYTYKIYDKYIILYHDCI